MSKPFVLTRTRGLPRAISLNDYFANAFPTVWNTEIQLLNLYIIQVEVEEVTRALSHRQMIIHERDGKKLVQSAVDFVLLYTKVGKSVDGVWIDSLCIAPARQTPAEAFSYMGKLYYNTMVIPFWLCQMNCVDHLNRGWIFQESRFPKLDAQFVLQFVVPTCSAQQLSAILSLLQERTSGFYQVTYGSHQVVLPLILDSLDRCLDIKGKYHLAQLLRKCIQLELSPEYELQDRWNAIFGVVAQNTDDLSKLTSQYNMRDHSGRPNLARGGAGNQILPFPPINLLLYPTGRRRLEYLFPELFQNQVILIGKRSEKPDNTYGVLLIYYNETIKFGWCDFEEIFQLKKEVRILSNLKVTYYFCAKATYLARQSTYRSMNPTHCEENNLVL